MGTIAWVVLGLVAGLFANLLIPGKLLASHLVTRRGNNDRSLERRTGWAHR